MARRIFVAATSQHCGKTAISVCLLHLARRRFGRVGYIKPVGQRHVPVAGREVDKDVALMAGIYDLDEQLPWASPVVARHDFTRRFLDGEVALPELERQIVEAAAEIERRCDFVVIEGTGHGGVGSVLGLDNARVARLLDADVVVVTEAGIGRAVDAVALNHALYDKRGARLRAAILNKLLPAKRDETLRYVERALAPEGVAVVRGLDYSPVLANPTLKYVARTLGQPLRGDPAGGRRIVHNIHLGAASTQRVVDLLGDATLVISTGTRDELLVTLSALYKIPSWRERIAGMVITGAAAVSPISMGIVEDSGIPYIRIEDTAGDTLQRLNNDVSKLTREDDEKIALLQKLAEEVIDFDGILRLLK